MPLLPILKTWCDPDPASNSELVMSVKGKSWLFRIPLVLLSAWYAVLWCGDPDRTTWFFGLNLGIHEAGHLLTQAFPVLICAAAGSVLQCVAPLIAMGIFLKQRDFAALGFCLTWLASNLFYVALYIADASHMALPLLSVGGGETYHDWNTILDSLGLLGYENVFAGLLRLAAYGCAFAGVAWTCWVLRVMARINA